MSPGLCSWCKFNAPYPGSELCPDCEREFDHAAEMLTRKEQVQTMFENEKTAVLFGKRKK